MSAETTSAGLCVGREWNRAMVAAFASKDPDIQRTKLYEIHDGDVTVAAESFEQALAFFYSEESMTEDEVRNELKERTIEDGLYEDREGLITHPDNDCDLYGERRLYTFRDALDARMFEFGETTPFYFADTYG